MAKKKAVSAPSAPPAPPLIYEASTGAGGAVVKGAAIAQAETEMRRRAGENVVVCGTNLAANRRLAETIERKARLAFLDREQALDVR